MTSAWWNTKPDCSLLAKATKYGITDKPIPCIEPLMTFTSPTFQKKLPIFLAEATNTMLYNSSKYHLFRKNLYKMGC